MISLIAPVAELVDAPDSKSGSARSAGSSPARGTTFALSSRLFGFVRIVPHIDAHAAQSAPRRWHVFVSTFSSLTCFQPKGGTSAFPFLTDRLSQTAKKCCHSSEALRSRAPANSPCPYDCYRTGPSTRQGQSQCSVRPLVRALYLLRPLLATRNRAAAASQAERESLSAMIGRAGEIARSEALDRLRRPIKKRVLPPLHRMTHRRERRED